MKISFVVPCYNEEKDLEQFYKKLKTTADGLNYDYEIVFVDDGSKDKTALILKDFSKNDSSIKVVTLSRNFGQQSCLMCGFNYATGDCVIELDVKVDLPFDIIPDMVKKWEEGYEVIHAKNKCKKNPFKRFFTKIYLWFLNKVAHINIPIDTDEFKLYDRKVIDELCSMQEQDKYVLALTSWVGFKQTSVEYKNKVKSKSKKNIFSKAMGVASAGIIRNSTWPLCLSFWIGTLLNIACQVCFTVFTGLAMAKIYLPLTAWLFPTIVMLFSILFTVNAFTNTYLGRIYEEVKGRPDFIVKSTINCEKK